MTVQREEVLASLRALLGESAVVVEPHELERYEKGWRYGRGKALAAVRPSSTEEVSRLLRHASAAGLRVVAQGGNTGLVGASTPDGSGEMLVLSLERLSRTVEVDPVDRTVTADGGVLLSTLDAALAGHGLLFPIDLGADPSIGGMVATNTGGTRLLRYGDVRQNLLGLEAVLADGTVLDLMRPLRKNNTGFDARQLFVGTSGVFGVVTKAVMRVVPRPVQRVTALVGLSSGAAVLGLLAHLEGRLGEVLTAFEAIGAAALAPVFRHQPRLRDPFGGRPPAYTVLVELSSTLDPSRLALDDLLESALGERLEAADGARDHGRLPGEAVGALGDPPPRLREPPPGGRGPRLRHLRPALLDGRLRRRRARDGGRRLALRPLLRLRPLGGRRRPREPRLEARGRAACRPPS